MRGVTQPSSLVNEIRNGAQHANRTRSGDIDSYIPFLLRADEVIE
jgi:hypothetical protein